MQKGYLKKISRRDLGTVLIILIIGIGGRIMLKDVPNVETLTLACLLTGAFLGRPYVYFLPLLMIAVTDVILGNNSILLFTWSAWLGIGIFSLILGKINKEKWFFPLTMAASSVVTSIFFFLWTNFGVWLLFDMYPRNLSGLLMSYLMGLPFLKFQILGNLAMILPVALGIFWGSRILKGRLQFLEKKHS
jgi:hypothetical protein